jgi:hypothetical protein
MQCLVCCIHRLNPRSLAGIAPRFKVGTHHRLLESRNHENGVQLFGNSSKATFLYFCLAIMPSLILSYTPCGMMFFSTSSSLAL